MEADWEIEVGGEAPVIDAHWYGFIDLRSDPERILEIAEAVRCSALGQLLLALNRPESLLWTAKCDMWEPDASEVDSDGASSQAAQACYVDLLPVKGQVFSDWKLAENFCRVLVDGFGAVDADGCRVDLVVRRAIVHDAEGFGITAYVGACGEDQSAASEKLGKVLAAFAAGIPTAVHTARGPSKLQ